MKKILILFFTLFTLGLTAQETITDVVDSTPNITANINADNSVTVVMEFFNVEGQFVQKTKTFATKQLAKDYRTEQLEIINERLQFLTDRKARLEELIALLVAEGLSKQSQKQAWNNITVE